MKNGFTEDRSHIRPSGILLEVCLAAHLSEFLGWTPANVKLLLTPLQSRGNSRLISVTPAEHNVPRRVSSAEPAGERRVRERVLTTPFGVLDHDLGGHPV